MAEAASEWSRVLRISHSVAAGAESKVLLKWEQRTSDDAKFEQIVSYKVDPSAMQAAAARARGELNLFVKVGKLGLGAEDQKRRLAALAEAGMAMFEALFAGDGEDGARAAETARAWYAQNAGAERGGGWRIEFCNDPSNVVWIDCPWNLVFETTPHDALDQLDEIALHSGFWANRHRACAYQLGNAEQDRLREDEDDFRQDEPVHARTVTWERTAFHAYVRGADEIEFMFKNACEKQWTNELSALRVGGAARARKAASHFFYLNRRDVDGDERTTEDRLSADKLKDLCNQPEGLEGATRHYLGLIDGTAAMAEAKGEEWYRAVQENSWSAFIVAEAKTEGTKLDFFGVRLLACVLKHKGPHLLDALAMARAHEDVRPWGLVYSLYADPGRVQVYPPEGDFSAAVLRTGKMLEDYWQKDA